MSISRRWGRFGIYMYIHVIGKSVQWEERASQASDIVKRAFEPDVVLDRI